MPLLKSIEDAIRSSAHGRQVRDLQVSFDGNCVVLIGHTVSFYAKQMAQEVAKKCLSSELRLENRIDVLQS